MYILITRDGNDTLVASDRDSTQDVMNNVYWLDIT